MKDLDMAMVLNPPVALAAPAEVVVTAPAVDVTFDLVADEHDSRSLARGLFYGVLFSMILWAGIVTGLIALFR